MSIPVEIQADLAREARHEIYKDELKNAYRARIQSKQGRKWEYISKVEPSKTTIIASTCLITGVGSGVLVGGVCGALCGTPGGPIGVGAGIGIGVAVGGSIGFAVASGVVYYEYTKWLKTEEGKSMGGEIASFLENDPNLQDYICGISHELVSDPVKTPEGHVYNRKDIKKWIDQKGTNPQTRQPLTEDMLQSANDVIGKVASCMIKLIDEDIETLEGMDKGFMNGLKFLRKDIEKKRDTNYNAEVHKLQNLRKQDKITGLELTNSMLKLQQDFYPV